MTILTIQPSDSDNSLDGEFPTNNFGTTAVIFCNPKTSPNNLQRPILKFDFSVLPADVIITSAVLSLYLSSIFNDPVGRTYFAYRITQTAWTELGSTWNKYDGITNWATAGGDFTTIDGASAIVPTPPNWMNFDVKAQVQFARDNTSDIAHFLIKDGTESGSTTLRSFFRSNDWTVDLTVRPKLVIEYDLIEADFEGTPRKKIDSLTVQFTDKSNNTPTSWSWKRRPSGIKASYVEFSTAENPSENFDIESP